MLLIIKSSKNTWWPETRRANLENMLNIWYKTILSKSFSTTITNIFKSNTLITYSQNLHTIIASFIFHIFNKNHIHVIHGNYYLERQSKKWIKKLFRILFNLIPIYLSNNLIFPSSYLFENLSKQSKYFLKHKNKCHIVLNSIDYNNLPKTRKNKKTIRILTITNFDFWDKCKWIIEMINWLNIIKSKWSTFELNIVWDWIYFNKVKKSITKTNFPINWLWYCPDIKKMYINNDLFFYCSYLDSGPIVILEAIKYWLTILTNIIWFTDDVIVRNNSFYWIYKTRKEFLNKASFLLNNTKIYNDINKLQYNYAKEKTSNDNVFIQRQKIIDDKK